MDNRYTNGNSVEVTVRERILLVDDEEPIREIIASMLAAEDYQCLQAGSGNEALAILDSGEKFDLILSGLMMADLDGLGLLKQVKIRYPGLPFVFVSAVYDVTVALTCLRCGALDYLRKPFDRQDLSVVIRRAFEHEHLRRNTDSNKTSLQYLVAALTADLRDKVSKINPSDEEAVINTFGLRNRQGYCSRIVTIIKAMGLNDGQIDVLVRAVFLHRASQIQALMNILLRPEHLLPDELAVVWKQCHEAHEIFQSIPCLADASEIMFACYERFDGTGHPRGLTADEIPLLARIFGVASAVDSIIVDNWRMSRLSLHAEIQRWSGSRFDPEVVNAVLSIPEETWAKIR